MSKIKAHSPAKPNPGTQEAIDKNCTCPVIDNHYGKGRFGNEEVFIYNTECPLHTVDIEIKEDGELLITRLDT